ncbi:MAG: family 78 glycoside hydrolase catalytic domain [Flavobacteriaceae bacterium]|nr:family 78 glycoside hydrolase catalytic domain [Flavobacteriaceae bacterium]
MKHFGIIFSLFVVLFFVQCAQENKLDDEVVFYQNKKANWIKDHKSLPLKDSLFYEIDPAPLFRKNFFLEHAPKKVQLFITAAGYYKAAVNGTGIENSILDPSWTDYSKRIYFQEYDITSKIQQGENCIGVVLGNGFYNPLPLKMWGRINLRDRLPTGKPRFIAKIIVTDHEGNMREIVTDTTWKYSYGPIVKNSVYLGTHYDARKEIKDWNLALFNDKKWQSAVTVKSPGGRLQKAFFPPVQVHKRIKPINIYNSSSGKWIIDMGENFTGTYRIKIKGEKGDQINLRFGERIFRDGELNPLTSVVGQIKKKGMGGPGAPAVAWQSNSYTIGDTLAHWFTPDFTYHAFRYMEIDGLNYQPKKEDIAGLSIHTNVDQHNNFSSSSSLINDIQNMVRRTFLANLVGVQSDCPAREKFGYGGDLNATSPSFIYNFDMRSFYKKTVYDWVDAINDSTFVDTAPNVGIQYCGISWESAFLITQYQLYLFYNDVDLIRELYPINTKWMEKVAALHPKAWVESGLSDHESLSPVPVELIGTLHYLQSARIMTEFAELMEDRENKQKYHQLAIQLEDKLRVAFWDKSNSAPINRQTLFASLLYHDIIPEDEIERAKDSLMDALQKAPSKHLTTGIFGTKFALEAISKHLSPQITFDIVNSKSYPGWGHMVNQGATTLWETWQESEDIYSNSHPMFGSVTEWFYRWLGGIQPNKDYPGFQRFFIKPFLPKGLDSISALYNAPQGEIISRWKKDKVKGTQYEISVPEKTIATVVLRKDPSQKVTILREEPYLNTAEKSAIEDGTFELKSGNYTFVVSPSRQL